MNNLLSIKQQLRKRLKERKPEYKVGKVHTQMDKTDIIEAELIRRTAAIAAEIEIVQNRLDIILPGIKTMSDKIKSLTTELRYLSDKVASLLENTNDQNTPTE